MFIFLFLLNFYIYLPCGKQYINEKILENTILAVN